MAKNNKNRMDVDSVDAATVQDWLERGEIVLVDVRETSEYEQEHIPGAMLLPMSKFDPELFPTVPGKKVVLHCAVGKRSESAGKILLNEGYESAVHLTGGIEAWKAAGYATEVQITPPALVPNDSGARLANESGVPEIASLCPPPGQVLIVEYLDPLKITPQDLAEKIGVSEAIVDDLINGNIEVSVELSLRLARFFSTAADFWLHLQIEHGLEVARRKIGARIKREVTPRTASE